MRVGLLVGGITLSPPMSGAAREPAPPLCGAAARLSPLRQSRAAELPVEDGAWDAVWGRSRALDSRETRLRVDIGRGKMNECLSLLVEVRTRGVV